MDPHLICFQLLLSFILFNGNECYRDYFDSFPRSSEDHEEERFFRSFRSQLQSPDSGFRPRVRASPRIISHSELEERLHGDGRVRRPSNSNRGYGSRVTASSSSSDADLTVSPGSNTERREQADFTHSSRSPPSAHPTPFLEIAGPHARPPAGILPLGQDIRSVISADELLSSHRPHHMGSEVHEARSRADFVNPLPAHSAPVDEPDPKFVNRNFRRPPQRFSRPFPADHLVDEETPFSGPTSPVPVESAAPAPAPVSPPATSFASSSSSSSSSQSNARRYPNYLRNADAFDRDSARRQLADQRRTELRMQEEERIKDEMRRLEDEKREEERIRLETDRRLAEEERARNDRRETEGLRLEAEMNEKRDGMLRQQERGKDKIQTAKENADRILESYVPIRNGRRPFDPEDHIEPEHHDPDRGSANQPPADAPPATSSRNRFGTSARASQRSSTAMTTSSTTTTTTTTTTPAPTSATTAAILPRPAGRPGGRRFIGRHRVNSENDRPPLYKPTPPPTSTTTTSAAARADYDDEYEDEYDYATTTTPKPKRRRNRRRSTTTTTTPSTTAKTLSPGYKERADGRIIDFQADPNFPFELKGADLTDYPFYVKVPDKVQFDCKGRHDGYYANVDLYCQIYHHCAIGYRYDFLCPNYTLFDQTTFTCRFINTVNCGKSANFYKRNEDLYVESTTPAPQENKRNSDQETGRFKKKKNRNRGNDRGNENTRNNSSSNNNNNNNDNHKSSSMRIGDSGGGGRNNKDGENPSNNDDKVSSNSNNKNAGSSSGNSENKSTNEGSNEEKVAGAADDEEYEDSRS